MSVAEERRRLWNTLMNFEDAIRDDLDRLILEVQAEMPCYLRAAEPLAPENERCGFLHLTDQACPSCTARMKLKETADAR